MAELEIRLVPLLKDNYAFLLHDAESGLTAVVDPSEAAPVEAALEAAGWRCDFILNTHHHLDHTGGNLGLKAAYGAQIVAPARDAGRIAGIDRGVAEGDIFRLGRHQAEIVEIEGHTSGHIAFWFRDDRAVFCGDTLFALGCGRLFEGTPAQMWRSLGKLAALPPETRVYCGHEYTAANLRFALEIEPENPALLRRAEEIADLRALGLPTVPSTVALELATNPFLRADRPEVQARVGAGGALDAFAEIRRRKDVF